MAISFNPVICTLSEKGDSFLVEKMENGNRVPVSEDDYYSQIINPVFEDTVKCKTHLEVLNFLEKIQTISKEKLNASIIVEGQAGKDCSSVSSIINFVSKKIDLCTVPNMGLIARILRDVNARGDVTFWGGRVIRYGENVVDHRKLHKHISSLASKKEGKVFEPLLDQLSWCVEDSYRACKTRNIFTRFLFWLRGGRTGRPEQFRVADGVREGKCIVDPTIDEKRRDFLYFLREQKVDGTKLVQIALKGEEDLWCEDNIVKSSFDHMTRAGDGYGKLYSAQKQLSFTLEEIESIKNCD